MKKFAAIFISVVLAALMVITPVVSAAIVDDLKTAAEARSPQYTGTLELTKLTPKNSDSDVQKSVTGAEFTAYRVLDLNSATGLFTVNSKFATFTSTKNGGKTLEQLLLAADDGLTFRSTEIFGGTGNETTDDGIIPELQSYVEEKKITGDQVVKDNTNDADENGVYLFKDLPLGVYLIVETTIPNGYVATSKTFLVSIPEWDEAKNSWNFDIKAKPKDDPINLSKEIVETGKTDVVETTKKIGDNVPYKVVADIPNYGKLDYALTDEQIAAIKYTITDTMSEGLTFNWDLKAFIDVDEDGVYNAEGSDEEDILFTVITDEEEGTPNGDYYLTVEKSGTNTVITINFYFPSLNPYQGKNLTLTYSATLNEKAAIGSANTNEAQLEYTNNPRPAYDDPTTNKTDKKKTSVFTYAMDLTKTFNGNTAGGVGTKTDASGVEFSLREQTADGEKSANKMWFVTEAKKEGDKWVNAGTGQYYAYTNDMSILYSIIENSGKYEYEVDENGDPEIEQEKVSDYTEGKELVLLENGKTYIMTQKLNPAPNGSLKVDGLNVGTYYLTEENSIEGWSKLAGDVIITVSSRTTTDGNNDTVVDMKYVDATSKAGNETARDLNKDSSGDPEDDARFSITINNIEKQFDLPLTGGAGLLAFTIGGGIVIAGAIIIFSMLRKKKTSK